MNSKPNIASSGLMIAASKSSDAARALVDGAVSGMDWFANGWRRRHSAKKS